MKLILSIKPQNKSEEYKELYYASLEDVVKKYKAIIKLISITR